MVGSPETAPTAISYAPSGSTGWSAPSPNVIKVNIDAAANARGTCKVISLVARDTNGKILWCLGRKIPNISAAPVLEAMGLREALFLLVIMKSNILS
ncbi:conserved hypothetical protein [Ricinus communis]|uniref:RNase H type-1 domain-containing protein n=1 Tax=Ricinus communis TaxID=3988 RepID=B9RPM8_RICCO|nr:conserved hypothetical protein [Ricinus communis]